MKVVEPQSKSRKKSTSSTRNDSKSKGSVDSDLQDRIEINAYYRAQARGFVPGHELEDWLVAEKEEEI